jgi:epoxyqueuosine reductase
MFPEIETTLLQKFKLDQVSWINLKTPLTIEFYKNFLDHNFQGSMNYLKDHFEMKSNPQSIDPEFKSVITVTQSYFPPPTPLNIKIPARVASYAQNKDYHFWIKEKLNQCIQELKIQFPDEVFAPFVDSGPILEKDYAYQAGHGWFGKNTCLIHPKKGSFFFIAEILTSIEVKTSIAFEPLPDFCGTCTKCMDICPTGALISPKVMKADQCIAYYTIESKITPPLEMRKKINDWFFGCDLCQSVCPWNEKFFREQKIEKSHQTSTSDLLNLNESEQQELIEFYRMILTSSNKALQKHFHGSAFFRASGYGLKRNALIVVANRKLHSLKNEVSKLKDDPKLAELAEWTLRELN